MAIEILVIEDEARLRRVMVRILTEAGYRVSEAADGHTGLGLYRRNRPAVVVTDLFMPDGDGIETIRTLRLEAERPGIVATSGGGFSGRLDLLRTAAQLGAEQVLRKPFRAEELLEAVAASIAGRRSAELGDA